MAADATSPQAEPRLDLKDPVLAGLLAWLIPGAGHFYQGRHAKAVLFFVCILGTFIYGMSLGRGRCVYFQWEPASMRRWSYLCQVGAGLPALPALVGAFRSSDDPRRVETLPFLDEPWYMPPKPSPTHGAPERTELDVWYTNYGRDFELGTVFTMIAGLLNILAVFDALSGPAAGLHASAARKDEKEPAQAAT